MWGQAGAAFYKLWNIRRLESVWAANKQQEIKIVICMAIFSLT